MLRILVNKLHDICWMKKFMSANNDFYCGDDAIIKYIRFHIIVTIIQKLDGYTTILDVTKELIDTNELESQYYNNGLKTSAFDTFYEKVIERYHTCNARTRLEYDRKCEANKEDEISKNKITDSKILIPKTQVHQLLSFNEIYGVNDKDTLNSHDNLRITLKRMKSRKGYLRLVNYKSYEELHNFFYDKIMSEDCKCKSLEQYQLEKGLGYHLTKKILKNINEHCKNEKEVEEALEDLINLYALPIIDVRQSYVDLYFTGDVSERKKWRTEVEAIIIFIEDCLGYIGGSVLYQELSDEIKKEDDKFSLIESYYNEDQFRELSKKSDLNVKNLKKLFECLDKVNQITINEIDKIK